MLNFFKKKPSSIELFSPVDGEVVPIEAVSDEVFSSKMMGDGFAVKPMETAIFSPISGEVISVFPTKHALALKNAQGLEVLLHMGIDTVELEGTPFEIFVVPGEKINEKKRLATVDLSYLEEYEKSTEIIVVFTNLDELNGHLKDIQYGHYRESASIGRVTI